MYPLVIFYESECTETVYLNDVSIRQKGNFFPRSYLVNLTCHVMYWPSNLRIVTFLNPNNHKDDILRGTES